MILRGNDIVRWRVLFNEDERLPLMIFHYIVWWKLMMTNVFSVTCDIDDIIDDDGIIIVPMTFHSDDDDDVYWYVRYWWYYGNYDDRYIVRYWWPWYVVIFPVFKWWWLIFWYLLTLLIIITVLLTPNYSIIDSDDSDIDIGLPPPSNPLPTWPTWWYWWLPGENYDDINDDIDPLIFQMILFSDAPVPMMTYSILFWKQW